MKDLKKVLLEELRKAFEDELTSRRIGSDLDKAFDKGWSGGVINVGVEMGLITLEECTKLRDEVRESLKK